MQVKLYIWFELTILLICLQLLIGVKKRIYVLLDHNKEPSFWRWLSIGAYLVYAASVMAAMLL